MKKMLFGAAMLCVALTGCENEDFTAATQSQVLRFDAPAMMKTRANVMGEISGVKYPEAENFTVFCKSYTGKFNGWNASENAANYFDAAGEVASNGHTVGTSSYWTTAITHYWPEIEYSLAFAAYSPAEFGTAAKAAAEVSHTATGLQIKNFMTEVDCNKQYDLMYSNRKYDLNKTNANSAVPLVFNHALSSIVFSSQKASTDVNYEITSVKVNGKFSQKGNFNQGITETPGVAYSETASPEWTELDDATATVTYSPSFNAFQVPAESPAQFTSGTSAMLLIPQDVPEDAEVTVYYTKTTNPDTDAEKVLSTSATIKLLDFQYVEEGTGAKKNIAKWEMGKRYIYRIAFGQNTRIYFEPSVVDWVTCPTLIYTIQ